MAYPKLNLKEFNECVSSCVLAQGDLHPETSNAFFGDMSPRKFVAAKGKINDWAVYVGLASMTFIQIRKFGTKIYDMELVRNLVSASEDVYKLYRK